MTSFASSPISLLLLSSCCILFWPQCNAWMAPIASTTKAARIVGPTTLLTPWQLKATKHKGDEIPDDTNNQDDTNRSQQEKKTDDSSAQTRQQQHLQHHNPSQSEESAHHQQHATIATTTTNTEANRTIHYEKQYRVRQARAKLDAILQGPEAPIDLEQELQRVKSIAPLKHNTPPLNTAAARSDKLRQVRWNQLEQELHKATLAQDFEKASVTKDEMGKLHVEDCGAVLQVNAKYYQAFSEKNIETMQQVWFWNDNTATCIHPSQKPLVGTAAVLESWKKMFQVKAGAFQKSWMEPHQIRLRMAGHEVAIVTCDEHVYARRFVRGQRRVTELVNKLQATNVFRKDFRSGRWFLTHHHASWHANSEAAQQALKGPQHQQQSSSRRSSGGKPSHRLPMGYPNEQENQEGETDCYDHLDDEEADAARAMDNIMGIKNFGPLLGDGKANEKDDQHSQDEASMIMGSLSDIINGGLGGGAENPLGPAAGPRKAIIRVSRIDPNTGEIVHGPAGIGDDDANQILDDFMQSYDEEDDEDEEDEDEDDDDDMDDDDDEYVKLPTPPKALRPKARIVKRPSNKQQQQSKQEKAKKNQQACIATLRKLSEMGAISPRQKLVLINDIIRSSASSALTTTSQAHGINKSGSKLSLVEIAYQLLVAPTEEDKLDPSTKSGDEEDSETMQHDVQEQELVRNMALEEFADQCRVIATELMALSSSEAAS